MHERLGITKLTTKLVYSLYATGSVHRIAIVVSAVTHASKLAMAITEARVMFSSSSVLKPADSDVLFKSNIENDQIA